MCNILQQWLDVFLTVHHELTIYWLPTWRTDYYLFIKCYSPLHVSSLKCSSSEGYSCINSTYGTVTLYESSWWPVGTQLEWELTGGGRLLMGVLRHPPTTYPLQSVLTQAVYRQATTNSHREWQYHMLNLYNCILLKMSTWGSKHVEENSILWINNNQCIKLVINIESLLQCLPYQAV